MKVRFWKKTVRVAPVVEAYISRRYEDLAVCIHADIAKDRGLYNYYAPWLDYMMEKYELPDHVRRKNTLIVTDSEKRHIGCSGAVGNTLDYYNPLPDQTDHQVAHVRQLQHTSEKNSKAKVIFVSRPKAENPSDATDPQQQTSCALLKNGDKSMARKILYDEKAQICSSKDIVIDPQPNCIKLDQQSVLVNENSIITHQIIEVKCAKNDCTAVSDNEDERESVVKKITDDLNPYQSTDIEATSKGNTVCEKTDAGNLCSDDDGDEIILQDELTCIAETCEDDMHMKNTREKKESSGGQMDGEYWGKPGRVDPDNKHDIFDHLQSANSDINQQQLSYEKNHTRSRLCSIV